MIASSINEPDIHKTIRKRSGMDGIKARTKCMACGVQGHWFKDNPECTRMMQAKIAQKEKDKEQRKSADDNMDVGNESRKKPEKSVFFRQRGQ